MAELEDTLIDTNAPRSNAGGPRADEGGKRAAFAQFATGAANRQIQRASGALSSAADSIDELLNRDDSPIDASLRGYVEKANGRLRDLADRAGEQDATDLLDSARKLASENPAITIAIGAALGAALGLAAASLGKDAGGSPPAN